MPYNSSNPSLLLLLSQLYHTLLGTDLFKLADYLDGPTPAPTYEELFTCLTPVLDLVEVEPLDKLTKLLVDYVEGRKEKADKASSNSNAHPTSDDAVAPKASTASTASAPTRSRSSIPYCPYAAPAANLTLTNFDAYLKALLSDLPDGSSYSFFSYKKADDSDVVVCKVNHEQCIKPLYVVAYDPVDAFAQVAETFGEGVEAIKGLAEELGMDIQVERNKFSRYYTIHYNNSEVTDTLEGTLKYLVNTKNDEWMSCQTKGWVDEQ